MKPNSRNCRHFFASTMCRNRLIPDGSRRWNTVLLGSRCAHTCRRCRFASSCLIVFLNSSQGSLAGISASVCAVSRPLCPQVDDIVMSCFYIHVQTVARVECGGRAVRGLARRWRRQHQHSPRAHSVARLISVLIISSFSQSSSRISRTSIVSLVFEAILIMLQDQQVDAGQHCPI